jgi:hypothetical protein
VVGGKVLIEQDMLFEFRSEGKTPLHISTVKKYPLFVPVVQIG